MGSRMSIERHCSLSLRASEARARRGGVRACCVSVAAMASMVGPRVYRHSETFATGSAAPRRRVPFLCLSKEKEPKERTPRRPRRSLRERSPGGAPCSGGASTAHPCADDACSTSCLAPRCARHPTRRFRRGPNRDKPQQQLPSPACGRGVGGEGRAQRGTRFRLVGSALNSIGFPTRATRRVGKAQRAHAVPGRTQTGVAP